ncbi:hypothetical protein EDB89DRAFT_1975837 [Lactarius sanguifluus]|nr:hypothetical protein EDB89DRAFT_1975837 [Lactarius sanguifluus]
MSGTGPPDPGLFLYVQLMQSVDDGFANQVLEPRKNRGNGFVVSTTHQPATTLARSPELSGSSYPRSGEILSQCTNDGQASLRFLYSYLWAREVRRTRHPSVSKGYESAVSLMRDALLFAPTLQLRHATLSQTLDVTHMVPLYFASYRFDLHRLEEAIETLESGRALL